MFLRAFFRVHVQLCFITPAGQKHKTGGSITSPRFFQGKEKRKWKLSSEKFWENWGPFYSVRSCCRCSLALDYTCSHCFRSITPISLRISPYISFLRYFGANTIWYLHLHLLCDKLFRSSFCMTKPPVLLLRVVARPPLL